MADRIFRITLHSKRKNEVEYKFIRKYFYDTKKLYEMELNHRDKELKEINCDAWDYSAKLICEEFVNNTWTIIEERIYGK